MPIAIRTIAAVFTYSLIFIYLNSIVQRGRSAATAQLYRSDRLPPSDWTFSPSHSVVTVFEVVGIFLPAYPLTNTNKYYKVISKRC